MKLRRLLLIILPITTTIRVAAANSPTTRLSFNGYSVILALALVGFASARFIRKYPKERTEII